MSSTVVGSVNTKPGRNDPCPCGSGRKYKLCCGAGDRAPPPALPDVGQLAGKAVAAFKAGRLAEASALTSQILSRQPQNFDATFLAALIAQRSGKRAEGEQLLRAAVALRPASAEAQLHLANALREAGKLAEAIAAFQRAIALKPNDPAAHNDLGLVFMTQKRWGEAGACFERAISLKPDFAVARYNLAMVREAEGRDGEAIAELRRVVALAPGIAEAQDRLGNLLHAYGYHADALACFRKAAAAQPNTTVGRLNRAKVLLQEEELQASEQCLRDAVAHDPRSGEAQRLLGMVLKQRGRFDEAIACFERAIALEPGRIATYHDLVYSKKLTPADQPFIAQMDALLAQPGITGGDRTRLHFGLGKAFDDLAAYDKAMAHFDAGNQIEHQRFKFDRARHAAEIDQTIATFTPDYFARQAAIGSNSELPILVLGMMRSGTTLVEQIISSHPEVAGGGELTFWGDVVTKLRQQGSRDLDRATVDRIADDYRALLASISPTARRVTDKMPHNFLWVGPIHTVFPRARIIHCRRNAIDTCLSIYFTHFAVAKEFAYDRDDIVFFYEQYLRLMAHWRRVLPTDRFLEIDYEELVADRERVSRRMIDFCGLAWDDACLQHERNERIVTTVSMWQARQPIYKTSVERWRRYEPWLGAFRRLLSEASGSTG